MSAFNTTVVEGNLTDDPVLRHDSKNTPVANLRLAISESFLRNGERTERVYYTNVVCWQALGVNVAESLSKGDRVIVMGRTQGRTIPASGDYPEREVTEIVAENVGVSLRWAKIDGPVVRQTNKDLASA
jgi:single-strand DNA-binding protein